VWPLPCCIAAGALLSALSCLASSSIQVRTDSPGITLLTELSVIRYFASFLDTVLLRAQEEARHEPLRLRRQAAAAAPGAGLPRASPGRRRWAATPGTTSATRAGWRPSPCRTWRVTRRTGRRRPRAGRRAASRSPRR
jgi:hypothetical protein